MRIDKILDSNFASLLQTEEISGKLVKYNGTNYIVNKSPVKIVDRTVGYSLILNDEKDIKNMGNDLSKQLVKNGLVAQYRFSDILCKSAKMERTISLAKKVALTDYTVLITGESGTGKELVAQSIHNYSKRSGHPFVAINCAALPESLLESELFGYEKGAFTGAIGNGKLGLFEQASSGTVFLDEIGDMYARKYISIGVYCIKFAHCPYAEAISVYDIRTQILAIGNHYVENQAECKTDYDAVHKIFKIRYIQEQQADSRNYHERYPKRIWYSKPCVEWYQPVNRRLCRPVVRI